MVRILSKNDYTDFLKSFVKQADEVNGTYEFQGISLKFSGSTYDIKENFGLSTIFEREFIKAISCFERRQIGPYITEKYFNLIPGVKKAVTYLETDCLESRRCVIDFPEDHCFKTMQFLFRDNTVDVVCYMRSCNVVKNLPHDLWICSKMADLFASYMQVVGKRPYKYHNITMMFGSLHMFKEDAAKLNVL